MMLISKCVIFGRHFKCTVIKLILCQNHIASVTKSVSSEALYLKLKYSLDKAPT